MSMLLMNQIAAADVPTPVAGTKTLFLDTDGIPKYKDSTGALMPIQAELSNFLPLALGPASAGTVALGARYDHQHPHGNQGGGSEHADATTSDSGFMSAADKTKLDALPGSAVANAADDESAAYTGIDNAQVGSVYAAVDDLNALRVAYEDVRGQLNALLAELRSIDVIET